MTVKVFRLPDLGEGLPDAEVVEWLVQAGDSIARDQPLVSVETDKAIVEVPSPYTGIVRVTHGVAGDVLKVGAPLAEFDVADADGDSTEKVDSGTVVGEVQTGNTVVTETASAVDGGDSVSVRATPAVRALAKRLGVDLQMVKPSGPKGSVAASDVERVAKVLDNVAPLEPLRGVRRAMARAMTQAHAEVVPVTVHDDAVIQHWREDDDITLRLAHAIVAARAVEPGLNAWYDSKTVGRRILDKVDLGIAVDTEEGLFVPVLRDVGTRSDDDLRAGLNAIKAAVRARDIPPEELRGCSITLSNFGTMGGRYASPIVVPPTVAILGAGAVRETVIAEAGQPVVRRVMPLSLTFDHRCVTGGEAARFLVAVVASLQA